MKFRMILGACALSANLAMGHFLTVVPESDHAQEQSKKMTVEYMFMHPFEQTYMEMVKPRKAGVFLKGKDTDVTGALKSKKYDGFQGWTLEHTFARPGDYLFYVDPVPYFESAEGKFIRHQTKVTVSAFGQEEGWDERVGLKAEILPLTRPYGLWAGNTFSGQILMSGKPVPNAEIEVEYYNEGSKVKAPHDSMITQVIKADSNGVFNYSMPYKGWWGFAALMEDDKKVKNPKDGKMYPVELGAVFWVKTY